MVTESNLLNSYVVVRRTTRFLSNRFILQPMTDNPTERNTDAAATPEPASTTAASAAQASPEPTAGKPLTSLNEAIEPLSTDLLYPSESDEPVTFVTCYLAQEAPLTEVQIKEWQMVPPSVYVEEGSVDDFWAPVLTNEDWYGDDEKKRTASFQKLKAILDAQLTGQQVFRQGKTEITVYLLGRLADGTRAGIQTTVVES